MLPPARWSAEYGVKDGCELEMTSARSEKGGKLSLPSVVLQLESHRLLDLKTLLQVSGTHSKSPRRNFSSLMTTFISKRSLLSEKSKGVAASAKTYTSVWKGHVTPKFAIA